MADMIGQQVVVRRMERDRYGDRTEVLTFTVSHCAFAPRITTERNDRGDAAEATAELFIPDAEIGLAIKPADVVELENGTRWEVHGMPEQWQNPFAYGAPQGVVVPLSRWQG